MALTTTSYAILGLLDISDLSAYELAQQAGRSLAYTWPVSESQLYAEPKRLASEGLITITTAASGPRRQRQEYSITPAGRDALRAWLTTPPEAPRLQLEVALRCLFATAGTPADLDTALRSTLEALEERYQVGQAMVEAMIESGGGPFPDRLHVNVLWMRLSRDLYRTISDWAEEARHTVAEWSTTTADPDPARTLAALAGLPTPSPSD